MCFFVQIVLICLLMDPDSGLSLSSFKSVETDMMSCYLRGITSKNDMAFDQTS